MVRIGLEPDKTRVHFIQLGPCEFLGGFLLLLFLGF
jgi:hypothetical protein